MNDTPTLPPPPANSGHIFYIAAFAAGVLAELVLNLDFFGWGGQFGFGLPVIIGGLALFLVARDQLRRGGAQGLVTGGAYARTRNPVHVSYVMLYAGFSILLDTPLALLMLALLVPALNRYVIGPEEDWLTARFGDAYRDYCSGVKRWL